MKRVNLFLVLFVCPIMALGQLKVQSDGIFKLNNTLAGRTGSSSNFNVSFGYGALSHPSLTGGWNTNSAFGYNALKNNTSGYENTAIGSYALYSNTSSIENVAVGTYALYINTTGDYNTAIGVYTLYNNTNGSYNTAVGAVAGDNNASYISFATSVGYGAYNTADYQVRMGNSFITSIGGYTSWTNFSDGRAKKNVRAEVPGLAFINLLQPVTYNLNLDAIDEIHKSDDPAINSFRDSLRMALSPKDKETMAKARANKEKQVYSGFIAQDVEKAAQSVGYDFSGVDAPQNDKSAYGLRYAEFVVPLVKAVQELSEQNSMLQEENNRLQEQNNRMQEQINELYSKFDALISAHKNQNVGVIEESETAKNYSFSLFPNPTSGFVTIDYTLNIDAPISIELSNMFGQRLKLIVPQQNQKAGTYSVQTTVSDLGSGTYIVKATSGNQVESKQLVINN